MKKINKLSVAVNSLAYYLLSYFFVFIIFQAFTVLAAKLFKFEIRLDYSTLTFIVERYEWDFDSVKLIYSAGPVAALLLAVVMIAVAIRFKEYEGKLKMFFLWGFVHSISMLLGSAYAGTLLGDGFGHVVIWMFVPDTGKLLVTLIALFLLAIAGFSITRLFLLTGNSYFNLLKTDDIPPFLVYQMIIPCLAGTALLALLMLPLNLYEVLRLLTPILVIMPVWINSRGANDLYFDETKKEAKISKILVITAVAFILVYRIGLQFPLQF